MVYSDQEILLRLQRGDRDIYEDLFNHHYKSLVLYAKKFVMETEIARDLVQDVFIYLWAKRQTINIDKSITSYLFRSVRNACINYLKRESYKESYINHFLININNGNTQHVLSEDVHELAVVNDLSAKIEVIVEGLPEQCRNIFRMSRFRGLKNREIAEIYSISTRTVETQIYRALKVLKENLQPYLAHASCFFILIVKNFLYL